MCRRRRQPNTDDGDGDGDGPAMPVGAAAATPPAARVLTRRAFFFLPFLPLLFSRQGSAG